MEFHVKKKAYFGGRCGTIRFSNWEKREINTPACMLYMRGGAAPHLTNEIINDLFHNDFIGVHITLPTMFQYPGPEVLKSFQEGIAKFLALQKQYFVYLSVQDPAQEIKHTYNEEKNISVWNSGGRRKIDIEEYLQILQSFKPDLAQCLCDTVPSNQTNKRNMKSVDRTLKFLDAMQDCMKNNDILKNIEILGSIEGGDSKTERSRSCGETSKRLVSGYVVEGINPADTPHWDALLKDVTELLEKNKPRFLHGPLSLEDVFTAFESGIDVFDSSYPYLVSQRGCSLNYQNERKRCKPESNHIVQTKSEPVTLNKKALQDSLNDNINFYELNIANKRYKEDFSPLVVSCPCYSCSNHSRAYIYHLLETKEMLAQVLLMIHNLHQYFSFFKNLRVAVCTDTYEIFKQDMLKS
ncbi:queuine tRNA-ribosyltransferase accessory subunit 2-like isoform X2 [Xenia sp. Carnegie-2017]|uniref:queuine tRNA-ribosyltransferase accessory subunit 2-like isoform X2 n=1 Tax=Xenia sp. Carnegie-2017 TaxID=2897299 RepID=UPI001F04B893|nr:queuine tRNA-ribosyltransferase accessory subunit 2-like isoform X2 [Xenia sp. Carnegie-2017]